MKKYLIPLAVGLLACTACMKESTFTVTNLVDIVTTTDGLLVNDLGTKYNVTANESGSETWKQEGSRLYILCDVLNRQLDIRLKRFANVLTVNPIPLSEMEHEGQDPVSITDHSFSGGYLNLVLDYYYNPSSNYARSINYYWDAKGLELHLYVFYDGNNENPAYLSEDSLKTQEAVYSVPLKPMVETGEYTSLHITFYEMDSSTKKIEKNTYRLSSAL